MQFKNVLARGAATVFAALLLALFAASPARAQEEGAPVVLDEPVVQVNNDVIMLSQLKRENAEFKEVLMKQRGMTAEQADAEIAKKQPEIIFNLINESLVMQKGKDMPRMSEEVEAEVNREVLRVAKNSNIPTIEQLEEAMKQEGLSLSDVKETLRRQYMKQAVMQREVDAKIYYGLTDDELRKYYDANRPKFASVTISEIFLSLAGRSESEVQAKAADIVARARGGADFGELAVKNSEREQKGVRVAEKTKGLLADEGGKPRWFLISDLQSNFSSAIKDLKAGGVSDPIKTDEGYLILRVNERDDAFKENFVRGAITNERIEKAREDFLRTLRKEAYVKPSDAYKEVITPLLAGDKAETAKEPAKPAEEKKEKNKKQ
ncbi:MAG TPA: peptidyl-prolyl cis-trans isomerase [Pyrinomonadaceae bacterium]|nr:peptidyl-prolyl cis-trans isomerase [Pyrinomonadaceae bacterium]